MCVLKAGWPLLILNAVWLAHPGGNPCGEAAREPGSRQALLAFERRVAAAWAHARGLISLILSHASNYMYAGRHCP